MKIIRSLDMLKDILSKDGIVFLQSDTIRGISCLASSTTAISNISNIKQREKNKTMILLISDNLYDKYICTDYNIPKFDYPTTIIYRYEQLTSFGKKNISSTLIKDNSTIAIRKVSNIKVDQIITYLWVPIVSTSINISGNPYSSSIRSIDHSILGQVDGIYRIKNRHPKRSPSHIATINGNEIIYIRK